MAKVQQLDKPRRKQKPPRYAVKVVVVEAVEFRWSGEVRQVYDAVQVNSYKMARAIAAALAQGGEDERKLFEEIVAPGRRSTTHGTSLRYHGGQGGR